MMSSNNPMNIRSRLIEIIKERTDEARRFKSLEELTRISGATWRTFWNRNSAPSGEMIEAISMQWPQYAFWLATGGTDPVAGHVAPRGVEGLWESVNEEVPEANEYFQYQMSLLVKAPLTLLGEIEERGLEKTGFSITELTNESLQREIARHMTSEQSRFKMTLEQNPLGPVIASDDYKKAREAVMNERRERKIEILAALRKRKSEVGKQREK